MSKDATIHQRKSPSHKSGWEGGSISTYIHDTFNFKSPRDLDINTKISTNLKSTFLSTLYISPDDFKVFNNFMKDLHSFILKSNKLFYALGNFNLNVLGCNKNKKVAKFPNLKFQHRFVSVINKPTRVIKNTTTAIDHIITKSLLHRTIDTGMIKLDISDHSDMFLTCFCNRNKKDTGLKSTNYNMLNKQ